jgi:hypothetical protein
VDGFASGNVEIENEQSHGDGEDAVAKCGEAFDTLSGNTVVEGVHRREFSIGFGGGRTVKSFHHGGHRGHGGKPLQSDAW